MEINSIYQKTSLLNQKLNELNREADERNDIDECDSALEAKSLNSYECKSLNNFMRTGISTKSLSEENNGKMLLNQRINRQILDHMEQISIMRKLCRVDTITGSSLDVIIQESGCEVGWVKEEEERDVTEGPKLTNHKIELYEMFAQPVTTQRLVDDAVVNIAEWLAGSLVNSFVKKENDAFINGDGIGKPLGILHSKEVVIVNELNVKSIVELINSLESRYLSRATFLLNRKTLAYIQNLQDSSGRFIWQSGDFKNMMQTIFGIPVICCDDMPAIKEKDSDGQQLLIALGDFKQAYHIIQSKNCISIMKDPYTSKPFVKFYATRRVGGDIVDSKALKILSLNIKK